MEPRSARTGTPTADGPAGEMAAQRARGFDRTHGPTRREGGRTARSACGGGAPRSCFGDKGRREPSYAAGRRNSARAARFRHGSLISPLKRRSRRGSPSLGWQVRSPWWPKGVRTVRSRTSVTRADVDRRPGPHCCRPLRASNELEPGAGGVPKAATPAAAHRAAPSGRTPSAEQQERPRVAVAHSPAAEVAARRGGEA